MKLIFITLPRPRVEDVDTFSIPSRPVEVRYMPGGTMYLFPLGKDFWTVPLYHN
jgi:hypothetical protein